MDFLSLKKSYFIFTIKNIPFFTKSCLHYLESKHFGLLKFEEKDNLLHIQFLNTNLSNWKCKLWKIYQIIILYNQDVYFVENFNLIC